MKNLLLSLGLICVVVMTLLAAPFWEKKDYTTWSREECMEILSKSPWTYEDSDTTIYDPASNPMAPGGSSSTSSSDTGGMRNAAQLEPQSGERENTLIFNLTLMTAKPVRMALGRLRLLQNPDLKAQVESYVTQQNSKEIVVQLRYSSNPPGSSALHDIRSFFQGAMLSTFATNTYLMGSDTKKSVYLAQYGKPDEKNVYPVFVFPRLDEQGQPLFKPTEKNISLRTEFEVLIKVKQRNQKFKIYVKMDPKKMVFQNEFAM